MIGEGQGEGRVPFREIGRADSISVVKLLDEEDHLNGAELKQVLLDQVADEDVAEIIIDFGDCKFIDSTFLSILVGIQARTVIAGKKGLSFANIQDAYVAKVFEITRTDKFFHIEAGLDLEHRPDWPAILAKQKESSAEPVHIPADLRTLLNDGLQS